MDATENAFPDGLHDPSKLASSFDRIEFIIITYVW